VIKYSTAYEIITEESATLGDAEERGFLDENLTSDFRDMVDILEGTEPSKYPLVVDDTRVWFTHYGDMDMHSGEYENISYHPKTARDCRYMIKAWLIGNRG